MEGGETYIEPDLNIFKGTMALSPKYLSQATNTIVMTPANTNDKELQNVVSAYILEAVLMMITALSFHGFVFPPHCRASETHTETNMAPNLGLLQEVTPRALRGIGCEGRGCLK